VIEYTGVVVAVVGLVLGLVAVLLRMAYQTGTIVQTVEHIHRRLCDSIAAGERHRKEVDKRLGTISERVRALERARIGGVNG